MSCGILLVMFAMTFASPSISKHSIIAAKSSALSQRIQQVRTPPKTGYSLGERAAAFVDVKVDPCTQEKYNAWIEKIEKEQKEQKNANANVELLLKFGKATTWWKWRKFQKSENLFKQWRLLVLCTPEKALTVKEFLHNSVVFWQKKHTVGLLAELLAGVMVHKEKQKDFAGNFHVSPRTVTKGWSTIIFYAALALFGVPSVAAAPFFLPVIGVALGLSTLTGIHAFCAETIKGLGNHKVAKMYAKCYYCTITRFWQIPVIKPVIQALLGVFFLKDQLDQGWPSIKECLVPTPKPPKEKKIGWFKRLFKLGRTQEPPPSEIGATPTDETEFKIEMFDEAQIAKNGATFYEHPDVIKFVGQLNLADNPDAPDNPAVTILQNAVDKADAGVNTDDTKDDAEEFRDNLENELEKEKALASQ